jgi:uncharacterized delta-60 repeat protein
MRVWRLGVVAAVAVATIAAGIASAGAEAGDLDATFGYCGVKPALVGTYGMTTYYGARLPIVQQRDGKILQFAETYPGLAITRLLGGSANIDRGYGTNGTVKTVVTQDAKFSHVALAPDGKLLVALIANNKVRLLRYMTSGALDPSFGTGGILKLPYARIRGLLVQSDNKPIVAVVADEAQIDGFQVVRLLEDGMVDSGYTFVQPSLASTPPIGLSSGVMTLQADDRLLIAGVGPPDLYRVARWNTDGSRDPSFLISTRRFETTDGPRFGAIPYELIARPGGKVVLATLVRDRRTTDFDIGVAQYLATGSPDPSFGTGGFAVQVLADSTQIFGVRVARDGSILMLARAFFNDGEALIGLAQFTPSGVADPNFGIDGHVVVDFGAYDDTNGFALTGSTILVGTGITSPGEFGPLITAVFARFRTDKLKQGAGFVLSGGGDLWPIRFGNDSPPPCSFDGPLFDDDFARGVAAVPRQGGYVVDAFGGLHPFSAGVRPAPAAAHGGPYWPGWDIVRGVATRSSGKGGYVLDAFGGLHGFASGSSALPAGTRGGGYWPGWDITRGVALLPSGKGGYILDAYGALHGFAVGANPMPAQVHGGPYWPGWDIARGVAILPNGTGGYIVDGFGGLHGFGIGAHAAPPPPGPGAPYFAGSDGARGVTFIAPNPTNITVSATSVETRTPAPPTVRWRASRPAR